MGKYRTADDVEVEATLDDALGVWTIKFPDGEVREAHDSTFADNFKKV